MESLENLGRIPSPICDLCDRWAGLSEEDKRNKEIVINFTEDMSNIVQDSVTKTASRRLGFNTSEIEVLLEVEGRQMQEWFTTVFVPFEERLKKILNDMNIYFAHSGDENNPSAIPDDYRNLFNLFSLHVIEAFTYTHNFFSPPLAEVIGVEKAMGEQLLAHATLTKKKLKGSPQSEMMHLIARYMTFHGYVLVEDAVYRYIQGTFRHAVERVMQYSDPLNEDSGEPRGLTRFLNFVASSCEIIQLNVRKKGVTGLNAAIGGIVHHQADSLVPKCELRHDYCAFKNGVVRLCISKKRARTGEYLSGYEFIPYDKLKDGIVCARYHDCVFDEELLTMPFGYIEPKPRDEITEEGFSVVTDEAGTHARLERLPGEGSLAYYLRFLRCFQPLPIEDYGDRFPNWLRDSNTYFLSDIAAIYTTCRRELRSIADAECRAQNIPPLPADEVEFTVPFYLEEIWGCKTLLHRSEALLHIMVHQQYSDSQMHVFHTMIGRGFFPSKTFDNWQCFLIIVGLTRTGKGVLLGLLDEFFGYEFVGQPGNENKDLFGNAGLYSKRIIYLPDIRDFVVFTVETVLKMSSNERSSARVMREDPTDKCWVQHLYMATNNRALLMKGDPKGALAARAVVLTHRFPVPNDVFSTEIELFRKEQLPANLAMALRSVTLTKDTLHERAFVNYLPLGCRASTNENRTFGYFYDFLGDKSVVKYKPAAKLPFSSLLEGFVTYMKDDSRKFNKYDIKLIKPTSEIVNDLLTSFGFILKDSTIDNIDLT